MESIETSREAISVNSCDASFAFRQSNGKQMDSLERHWRLS